MNIVEQSYKIVDLLDEREILFKIDRAGRVCYKSEKDYPNLEQTRSFVRNLIKRGHESVLEHFSFTALFVCDRGISHELVRHRLASFSQESTRYCNYSLDKFSNEITVINPAETMDTDQFTVWCNAMHEAEEHYFKLLSLGVKPEIARDVLPNSLKTEVVMTCNLREWRHVLRLRTSPQAHPRIRALLTSLLVELRDILPDFFYDIPVLR